MKKKITKRSTKRSAKRVVHHRRSTSSDAWYGSWGKDRSMIIMLAAGTIILVVVGMYMAGWL